MNSIVIEAQCGAQHLILKKVFVVGLAVGLPSASPPQVQRLSSRWTKLTKRAGEHTENNTLGNKSMYTEGVIKNARLHVPHKSR